jgi:hypothetical protein
MKKAVEEKMKGNTTVCLVPARTNTNWFHEWIAPHAAEVRFIQNGVKFVGYKRKSPFPVCLVMYRPEFEGTSPIMSTVNYYPERAPYPKNRKKRRKVVPKEVVEVVESIVSTLAEPPVGQIVQEAVAEPQYY